MSEPSLTLQLAQTKPHRATLIVRDEASLASVARFLRFVCPAHTVLIFEPWDCLIDDGSIPSAPVRGRRLDTLYAIQQAKNTQPLIVITTAEAALQPIHAPQKGDSITLTAGKEAPKIIDTLTHLGYERASTAYEIGDYAPRGGLIDIVTPKGAYRLDLFGDVIDKIRVFEAQTQKTIGTIDAITLYSLNEPQGEHATHLLQLMGDARVYTEGQIELDTTYTVTPLLGVSRTPTDLNKHKTIILGTHQSALREKAIVRLAQHGFADAIQIQTWPEPLAGEAYVIPLALDHSFETDDYIVLRGEDWCGEYTPRRKSKNESFEDASSLTEGELVVHTNHGLGRYIGLETVTVDHIAHDFLRLQYAGNGYLLVPIENMDMLSRYGSDTCIALDALGGTSWGRRKQKVVKRLAHIADALLKQAAERSLIEAPILRAEPMRYQAFCEGFPYRETLDQFDAVSETLHDMQCPRPMDRLLCGDVGFGKTEVALRAAFCAVDAGYQVAVLTPTSLLCRQHYNTWRTRCSPFKIRVEQLSRLAHTPTQTKKMIQDGSAHMVIGTHALLSNDVHFKNLGLVIVDEEHHFGVKQKEKLKAMQRNVHVLTLTATPIPRTLQFSLSGIRELSVIQTPPVERKHVRTFVEAFDMSRVREILLREHARGGQSFVVTPLVEDIAGLHKELTQALPDLRVAVAHGQLTASELERVVEGFYDGAFDILLSTNIIESGIDIPRANTMIINKADRFGLAQLYQLRGRVGRSSIQGFAHFTYGKNQNLAKSAQKRLDVIQGLQRLGSGFELARHDMELRGMGNLAGEEQSGHVKDIGVELYQALLSEAVLQAKAEQGMPVDETIYAFAPAQISLGIPILIPDFYVADLDTRLTLYRRIARLSDDEAVDAMRFELTDRFGEPPKEVLNLLDVVRIKNMCRAIGVEKIDAGHKGVVIRLYSDHKIQYEKLMAFVTTTPDVTARPDGAIVVRGVWRTARERLMGVKDAIMGLAARPVMPGERSRDA